MIAGLGSIGRRHLRNLLALGERDILLYRTHQSTLPDDELASFPVETDLDAALAHNPDAVIVANPTALHLDVAIPAARAGCHLLLEKPVTDRMDDRVNTLKETTTEKNVKVLVGFQFRFHPVLGQIRSLLESGELGKPLSARAHWGEYLPGWHPWEDYRQGYAARKDLGGGVVNTLCHPLDYMRWLFGEVDSLTAMTGQVSQLELEVEDVAEIVLNFKSGLIGSVHLDYFQQPPAHWLEINTEKGQVHWDNATGEARLYSAQNQTWQMLTPPEGFERNRLFMAETRHFIALARGEEPSRCSLLDGLRSMQMTDAVHASASFGERVVFSD
jgi:predicted dehydrogenase